MINEILGRRRSRRSSFGCQAPDSGNAEILAHYGTEEQKEKYLQPLLDGKIVRCFSMTEPQGGSDPSVFTTRAEQDGDEWVINGEKWFCSNLKYAAFAIVMAVTDPDVSIYQGMSMFLVPTDTPGVNIICNVGIGGEPIGEGIARLRPLRQRARCRPRTCSAVRARRSWSRRRRLGGGRIHHAMRTVGMCQRAFDMMCERALSPNHPGEPAGIEADGAGDVADSWIEIQQFRLIVLYTAWLIDQVEYG